MHKMNKSKKKRTVKFINNQVQKKFYKNAENFNLGTRLREKIKPTLKLNGT